MEKYTDSLVGYVTGGALVGFDGVIWCTTPGFVGYQHELSNYYQIFEPNSEVSYKGLTFQGDSYAVYSLSDGIAKVKNNSSAIVIGKCPSCLIIGFCDDLTKFQSCSEAIEKARDTLTQDYLEKGELVFS